MENDKQKLQKQWDDELVKSFFVRPDVSMFHLDYSFQGTNGVFPRHAGILRVPKERWQSKMTVARFVTACLPKLAKVLWNHTIKDAEKIIKALETSKIDTTNDSKEIANTKRERTLFDKSAKDFAVQKMLYGIYKDSIEHKNNTMRGKGIRTGRLR